MTLLLGALTIGLILSLLAMGVMVSFRIFSVPDITTDGSITLGAAVAATLIVAGVPPSLATLAALAAGFLAGATTGIIHTKFKIDALLSGILVMTALYSINLRVMGKSNVPLMGDRTLASEAGDLGAKLFGGERVSVFGWPVASADIAILLAALAFAVLARWRCISFSARNRHGNARDRRQRADGPRARRERGGLSRLRSRHGKRSHRALRRAARAIPGLRRRADGHWHGRVGSRERDHRRGAHGRHAQPRPHAHGARFSARCFSACSWPSRCAGD